MDDHNNMNFTYLCDGDENAEKVVVFGSTSSSVGGTPLERSLRTSLFFGTEVAPHDSRYGYGSTVTETSFVGPKGTLQISNEQDVPAP